MEFKTIYDLWPPYLLYSLLETFPCTFFHCHFLNFLWPLFPQTHPPPLFAERISWKKPKLFVVVLVWSPSHVSCHSFFPYLSLSLSSSFCVMCTVKLVYAKGPNKTTAKKTWASFQYIKFFSCFLESIFVEQFSFLFFTNSDQRLSGLPGLPEKLFPNITYRSFLGK